MNVSDHYIEIQKEEDELHSEIVLELNAFPCLEMDFREVLMEKDLVINIMRT